MGYAIICDARNTHGGDISVLGYVDRGKTTRDIWWTSDEPNLLFEYKSERAAQNRVDAMDHNNPRVVEIEEARRKIKEQRERLDDDSFRSGLRSAKQHKEGGR